MTELVERLRQSRDNPSVLQSQLVKLRGKFDGLVFVFEGTEDLPIYEELIGKIPQCASYEPLPAKGKKQVLGLLSTLHGGELLQGVYFFIDRDYDPPAQPHDHLYELPVYSIENILCTEEVLDSILKDELRCAGSPEVRSKVREAFLKFRAHLDEQAAELHLHLFYAYRAGLRVIKKPDRVGQFLDVALNGVRKNYSSVSDILVTMPSLTENDCRTVEDEFLALSFDQRQRGKYVLEAFRKWIKALSEDAVSESPLLFEEQRKNVGDPASCSLRRLASSCAPPKSLIAFLVAIGACNNVTLQH